MSQDQHSAGFGPHRPRIRRLGLMDYRETWLAMRAFTERREASDADEIWLLQHPPVYTMGFNAKHRAPSDPQGIAVVRTDRGGDITYHGPGQLVAYVLVDLRRRGLGPKGLVRILEQTAIDLLLTYGITGVRRDGAPGVYVGLRKIAQLGLRIRRGSSYHGLSLNVDMDLGPFRRIDPCGYPGLEVTQLADLVSSPGFEEVGAALVDALCANLGYNENTRSAAEHP
ncbi:MAG: lipoyl(octanoyl) transferase LipB [Gammaproteobacteria bacterium]|nr:lipoyl(octanoyl) transferase LipB [Gammaproteobacteria bacterium]